MSTAPQTYPTIEEVEQRFKTWRRTRKSHKPIPTELWQAAVSLTSKHSICAISKRLLLNPSQLKRRAPASCAHPPEHQQQSAPTFIELEIAEHGINYGCMIEMEDQMGSKMKIHTSDIRNLDMYGLCRAFWSRQA